MPLEVKLIMYFDISYYKRYKYFLKFFSKFDYESHNIKLNYQSKSDSSLLNLMNIERKKIYTTSDLIEVMVKVHNALSGNIIINTPGKSAIEIIRTCKNSDYAYNCLGTSFVLSEIYLAMGLKSRIVRCMPIDIHYSDCHVITEVFLDGINKWIFMDPSNKACFYYGKTIASTLEVRNALIRGKPLKIAPECEWKESQASYIYNWYMTYLMKNFIRFNCNISSDNYFDNLLELVPTNYRRVCVYAPIKEKDTLCGKNLLVNKLFTNSVIDFWPEV